MQLFLYDAILEYRAKINTKLLCHGIAMCRPVSMDSHDKRLLQNKKYQAVVNKNQSRIGIKVDSR